MNILGQFAIGMHVRFFRWSGGRVGSKMAGGQLLLLTTKGRKTGRTRTVPVMYIPDEAGNPVVAASYAGAPENPAWFNNLQANPDVRFQTEAREVPARAEVLTGDARAKLWAEFTRRHPRFADYQTKTTREIPLVALRPA